jgi:hypothetical protein
MRGLVVDRWAEVDGRDQVLVQFAASRSRSRRPRSRGSGGAFVVGGVRDDRARSSALTSLLMPEDRLVRANGTHHRVPAGFGVGSLAGGWLWSLERRRGLCGGGGAALLPVLMLMVPDVRPLASAPACRSPTCAEARRRPGTTRPCGSC